MSLPSTSECGRYLFLQIAQGHWIRTDICVGQVGCPQCSADVEEPCRGNGNLPIAATHSKRRDAATKRVVKPHIDAVLALAAVEPSLNPASAAMALRRVYGTELTPQDAGHLYVTAHNKLMTEES